MKSGKCPRCGSTEIYRSDDVNAPDNPDNPEDTYYYIQIGMGSRETTLVRIVYYVCGQCNHLETYVADDPSMFNIIRNWKQLNPNNAQDDE